VPSTLDRFDFDVAAEAARKLEGAEEGGGGGGRGDADPR
jgi:hypothetical protein